MTKQHLNPVQYDQFVGYARQACARIFRDGGSPADALKAFGLKSDGEAASDWSRVVEIIAASFASRPLARAA